MRLRSDCREIEGTRPCEIRARIAPGMRHPISDSGYDLQVPRQARSHVGGALNDRGIPPRGGEGSRRVAAGGRWRRRPRPYLVFLEGSGNGQSTRRRDWGQKVRRVRSRHAGGSLQERACAHPEKETGEDARASSASGALPRKRHKLDGCVKAQHCGRASGQKARSRV